MLAAALAACGSTKHGPTAVQQAERAAARACPDRRVVGCDAVADLPAWVDDEQLPAAVIPGAVLFARSGCTNCHTYHGDGTLNIGGADLTQTGRMLGEPEIAAIIRKGRDPMPAFAGLGEVRIRRIAAFLAASR